MEQGTTETWRGRHADYFLNVAEATEPRLTGPELRAALEQLEADNDNFRAALHWHIQNSKDDRGLRMAAALWRFWEAHGYLTEGREWLGSALATPHAETPQRLAKALTGAGILAHRQGDYTEANAMFETCLAIYRQEADLVGEALALQSLAVQAQHLGQSARATSLFDQALAVYRQTDDKRGVAVTLNNLGHHTVLQGAFEEGRRYLEEDLALSTQLGDVRGCAIARFNLGVTAWYEGDTERAHQLFIDGLEVFRTLEDNWWIAFSLHGLADIARMRNDHEQARALELESLTLFQPLREKSGMAQCFEGLAADALASGRADVGARLLGAAQAIRRSISYPIPPASVPSYERLRSALSERLGEHDFSAMVNLGRAMSIQDAAELAAPLGVVAPVSVRLVAGRAHAPDH
jgi:non-specific serine/threonine protein kinase